MQRKPRYCVGCAAELTPAQKLRCAPCALERRRERERRRDRRRAEAKKLSARARGYTTAHWRRIREEAIARAKCCATCGSRDDLTGHLRPELEGDHRAATLADVVVLCRRCHGAKAA